MKWTNEFGVETSWDIPGGAALAIEESKAEDLLTECLQESGGDINVALSAYAILSEFDESKIKRDEAGKFSEKDGGSPKKKYKHKELSRAAVSGMEAAKKAYEDAKKERRRLYDEAKQESEKYVERMDKIAERIVKEGIDNIVWDSSSDGHESFTLLEEQLNYLKDFENISEARETIEQIQEHLSNVIEDNKSLGELADDPDNEEWDQDQEDNVEKLDFIESQLEVYQKALGRYIKTRREMKAIRDGVALSMIDGAFANWTPYQGPPTRS